MTRQDPGTVWFVQVLRAPNIRNLICKLDAHLFVDLPQDTGGLVDNVFFFANLSQDVFAPNHVDFGPENFEVWAAPCDVQVRWSFLGHICARDAGRLGPPTT